MTETKPYEERIPLFNFFLEEVLSSGGDGWGIVHLMNDIPRSDAKLVAEQFLQYLKDTGQDEGIDWFPKKEEGFYTLFRHQDSWTFTNKPYESSDHDVIIITW